MHRVRLARREAAAVGGALIAIAIGFSGCAQIRTTRDDVVAATHMQTLGVDPSSPVAVDVARAEKTEGPIPSFASVPPKPTDARSAAAYRSEVVDVVGDRRALAKWETANPPGVNDTERYAANQRRILADQTPVSAAHEAESESFVKRLRAEAEAPPRKPGAKAEAKPKDKTTAPSAY